MKTQGRPGPAGKPINQLTGLSEDEILRRGGKQFPDFPDPGLREWIISRALDLYFSPARIPKVVKEFPADPRHKAAGGVVWNRVEIDPASYGPDPTMIDPERSRILAVAFMKYPDDAPAIWLWARSEGKKFVASRTGQALQALESENVSARLLRGEGLNQKDVVARLEKKHGGRGWDDSVKDAVKVARKRRTGEK